METLSTAARKEIVEALRTRYARSSKSEKGAVLTEYVSGGAKVVKKRRFENLTAAARPSGSRAAFQGLI